MAAATQIKLLSCHRASATATGLKSNYDTNFQSFRQCSYQKKFVIKDCKNQTNFIMHIKLRKLSGIKARKNSALKNESKESVQLNMGLLFAKQSVSSSFNCHKCCQSYKFIKHAHKTLQSAKHALIHSNIHSFKHSFIHLLTYPLAHSLIQSQHCDSIYLLLR